MTYNLTPTLHSVSHEMLGVMHESLTTSVLTDFLFVESCLIFVCFDDAMKDFHFKLNLKRMTGF